MGRPSKVIFLQTTGQSLDKTIEELQNVKKVMKLIPKEIWDASILNEGYMVSYCEYHEDTKKIKMSIFYDDFFRPIRFSESISDLYLMKSADTEEILLKFNYNGIEYSFDIGKRDKGIWNELTMDEED